jgi:hypothetical protein
MPDEKNKWNMTCPYVSILGKTMKKERFSSKLFGELE